MIRKIALICTILTGVFNQYAMKQKKHVIVGSLKNIVIQHNTTRAAHHLGFSGSLTLSNVGSFFSSLRSTKTLEQITTEKLFGKLKDIVGEKQTYPQHTWLGSSPPPIVNDWLEGQNHETILDKIQKHTKDSSTHKKAELSFDPEKNTSIMDPIPSMVELLKILKEQGNTVHLVANWHHEGFEKLKEKFPKEMKVFNGKIIISGMLKKVITPQDIPIHLQEKKINPQESVLLHTEQVEIKGLDTIVCTGKNTKDVRAKLVQHGLLK